MISKVIFFTLEIDDAVIKWNWCDVIAECKYVYIMFPFKVQKSCVGKTSVNASLPGNGVNGTVTLSPTGPLDSMETITLLPILLPPPPLPKLLTLCSRDQQSLQAGQSVQCAG